MYVPEPHLLLPGTVSRFEALVVALEQANGPVTRAEASALNIAARNINFCTACDLPAEQWALVDHAINLSLRAAQCIRDRGGTEPKVLTVADHLASRCYSFAASLSAAQHPA